MDAVTPSEARESLHLGRIRVAGVPVHILASNELEAIIAGALRSDEPFQIVFLRLWDLMRAKWNSEYKRMLEQAGLVVPVSRAILFGARFQEKRTPIRYSPFEFVIRVLGMLERRNHSLYLLGGRPAELKRVDGNVRRTFPGLRLLGRYVGTYPKTHHDAILTALRKAGPNFTLIGPGPTARERWVARNRPFLPPGIYLWSAEVFEILAEKRNRVPREVFERGTDFLHDGLRRPWRVLRLPVYGWYLLLLLYHRARHL